jgi:hypothetical protein
MHEPLRLVLRDVKAGADSIATLAPPGSSSAA